MERGVEDPEGVATAEAKALQLEPVSAVAGKVRRDPAQISEGIRPEQEERCLFLEVGAGGGQKEGEGRGWLCGCWEWGAEDWIGDWGDKRYLCSHSHHSPPPPYPTAPTMWVPWLPFQHSCTLLSPGLCV